MRLTTKRLGAILTAIYEAEESENCAEPTGIPSHRGEEIDLTAVPVGLVPSEVTWTADRGTWMWDGALVTLQAMGVVTSEAVNR